MLGKQFVSLTVSPAHRVSPAKELESSELVLLSRSWELGMLGYTWTVSMIVESKNNIHLTSCTWNLFCRGIFAVIGSLQHRSNIIA